MLDSLKHFLSRLAAGSDGPAAFGEDDERLATAVLLVHVAAADGGFGAEERTVAQRQMESLFGLAEQDAARLIAAATAAEHESVDLHRYTSLLRRRLDVAARQRMLAMMQREASAGGDATEVETATMQRLADLLGLSGAEN